MPVDVTTDYIRVRQHDPSRYEQKSFRTTPMSEDQGIFKVEATIKGTSTREVQTLLFAKSKDWTVDKVKAWITDHDQFSWPGTQATQEELVFVDEVTLADDTSDVSVEDLSKYIEIRQHPPGHFTGYQHKWLDKAQGIIKSVGQWRKTGAEAIQKLLFRRDCGWTEESVKAWFADHPEHYYPEPIHSGLFFAMADEHLENVINLALTAEVLPVEPATPGTVFNVIITQAGWGKNRRLGPDGRTYQDYLTDGFLHSMIPIVEGTAVQSVRARPRQEIADDHLPDLIKNTIAELQQYGHPQELINILFSLGLEGNTIGFLKHCRVEPRDDTFVVRADFCLADTADAQRSRQLWRTAQRHGLSKSLGLSINYKANVLFGEQEGKPACLFLQATRHVSTEFCPNPAAGGLILGVKGESAMPDVITKEAVQEEKKTEQQDTQLDIQVTQEETPNDKKGPEQPVKKEPDEDSKKTESDEEPMQETDALQALRQENAQIRQNLADVTGMVKDLVGVVKTHGTTLQHIGNETTKTQLTALVTQSTVSDDAKQDIMAQIDSGELADVKAVKFVLGVAQKAQDAVRATQGAPIFPGMSGVDATILKDPKDVNLIRSKMLWDVSLTQAEEALVKEHRIQKFHNWSEEYCTLTGDYGKTFRYNESYFQNQINPEAFVQEVYTGPFAQATILTTTYPEFLRNVIAQRMRDVWGKIPMEYKKVTRQGEPFTDTRDEEDFIPGMAPEIPEVTENGAYLDGTNGAIEKVTSSAKKYGRLFVVTEDDILNDRLGFVKRRADSHIMAMYVTIAHKVWKLFLGYGDAVNNEDLGDESTTGVPGGVLYHALRANYINGSINDSDKIKELVDLMMVQVDIAASGETNMPLPLQPGKVVCKNTNMGWVIGRLLGEYEPGYTDHRPNKLRLKFLNEDDMIGLHPYYLHDKPDFLGMVPNPATYDGIEIRYFRGQESPETVWENNQLPTNGYVFAQDQMRMRIKMRIRINRTQKKAFYALFEA